MKKLYSGAILLMFGLTLLSCGKDRVCTCTNTSTAPGSASQTTSTTYVDVSKGQAKAQCVSTTDVYNGVTYTSECKLD